MPRTHHPAVIAHLSSNSGSVISAITAVVDGVVVSPPSVKSFSNGESLSKDFCQLTDTIFQRRIANVFQKNLEVVATMT